MYHCGIQDHAFVHYFVPCAFVDVYKGRWQLELFFKTIKQNLKIHAFAGNCRNVVLTLIWIAVCMYLLLSYLKFLSKSGWSQQ